MIQLQKAELVTSIPDKKSCPDTTLSEIAPAGRSNVGRSSFINAMRGRKKPAYVGNTSGKTKLLNFFNLDDKYMFVGAPGYGYVNIPKTQLIESGQMMEDYFSERTQKKSVVIPMNVKYKLTDDDMTVLEFARYYGIPVAVVATKCDKAPPTKHVYHFASIRKTLKLNADEPLFSFSAAEKQGMEEIWNYLIPLFTS